MMRSSQRRILASVVSACLIASASAVAICGNAVWTAPPRFDGAGYAVLARAWMSGQGYRAIDHPDRPPHAHFPPGYPLLLAMTWEVAGVSVISAHVVSALCTMGASLAAWLWFRRMMTEPAATLLGLAVAINWLWARTGAAIQSEPLYLLLAQSAILAAVRTGRGSTTRIRDAIVLGTLLAACLLTRHAAIGLALAVLLDLAIRRRWRECIVVASMTALLASPWIVWMATAAGPGGRTQAGLLVQGNGTLPERIAGQLIFYTQRIPDQITGPFVEVGTVFRHSTLAAIAANGWAIVATAVIAGGWIRALAGLADAWRGWSRSPRSSCCCPGRSPRLADS